jgi:hypothetical protein
MMSGIERIQEERVNQVGKGWSTDHDDRYAGEELVRAAICYATPPRDRDEIPVRQGALGEGWEACSFAEAEHFIPDGWPWSPADFKPSSASTADRIRDLSRAGPRAPA